MANEIAGSVIMLSGPVGAGKSTVAKELIKTSANPLVYIEGDKFWFFFVKGFEKRGRQKNFVTIMVSMVAAAVPYATAGYDVLLDFSIPPWFLVTAIKILSKKNLSLEFIVLMPTEEVCANRAANREEGVIGDYTVYHDFYLSFNETKKNIIRDDSASAFSLAERIRKGLGEGLFHISQE